MPTSGCLLDYALVERWGQEPEQEVESKHTPCGTQVSLPSKDTHGSQVYSVHLTSAFVALSCSLVSMVSQFKIGFP